MIIICRKIKNYNAKHISGIAALPATLLISGIIFFMITTGAFLAFSFARGVFGEALSAKALSGARTGADDAIYRIIKNNYLTSYAFSLTGTHLVSVNINIEKDPAIFGTCLVAWGCRYRIISTGKALFRERRVEAILSVDPHTREIRRESFKEIEI